MDGLPGCSEGKGCRETVLVSRDALDEIVAHSRAEAPLECCGLLIGSPGAVSIAVRARNLRASRTRYLVDPADHFAAIRLARTMGLQVVGAYHSHPQSPPDPSPTDVAEAAEEGFLHVIVGNPPGGDAEIRCYRRSGRNFRPIDLVTEA
jgi:proteasome lid subunit RPN8/RPN11